MTSSTAARVRGTLGSCTVTTCAARELVGDDAAEHHAAGDGDDSHQPERDAGAVGERVARCGEQLVAPGPGR